MSDYQDFLDSNSSVPQELRQKVSDRVIGLLNPHPLKVFAKLSILHALVGSLSLAICHQFHINPFGTTRSLADWFTQWGGHEFCMVACGMLFISLTLFLAGWVLSVEEVRVFKRNEALQTGSLAVASLGLFILLGAHLAVAMTLLWMIGVSLGSWATTRLVWRLKTA